MCLRLGQITGLLSASFLICTCPNSPFFPSHPENVVMYLLKLNEDCWLSDTTLFLMMNWWALVLINHVRGGGGEGTFSLISFKGYFWTTSSTMW